MIKVKVRITSEYEITVDASKEEAEALIREHAATWTETDHLTPTGRFELLISRDERGVKNRGQDYTVRSGAGIVEWGVSPTTEVLSVEECA